MNLAQQYQRKTDKEHILSNPDTYIGSVENVDTSMYVYDDATNRILLKDIMYVPGLYKLFDEGIVNCRDHVIRMLQSETENKRLVTQIDVQLSSEDGTITLFNDGNGIDIAKHPEYDVWIPEMIFGQLRTSTNYNTEEERIVGGKNGFGFKLVLIWSTYGRVETVDHVRGLKYVQEFRRNLEEIGEPVITKVAKTTKPYTKVSFRPDYARFGLNSGLEPSMIALMKKRVYDIAAITDKKIKVTYNEMVIPVKNFSTYLDVYIGDKAENARVYEAAENGRWEYAISMSETHEFQQISFVNGICTFKGGKHVEYIMGQIVRKLVDYIEKKKKVRVNTTSIKEQLTLFLRCDVVNPAFDSQTKDFMNTPSNKFGSTCSVTDGFIEKVAKMGVMELACSLTEAKEKRTAASKTDGSKTKKVSVKNLIDANWAGGANSSQCVLILCEGLSAMSGIISGLSEKDKNTIGIYPLKGKIMNVRGELVKKISENEPITNIKKILGLENDRQYLSMEDVHAHLRYSKIMIMTDQDPDGSHIKGLLINLFHTEWPTLVHIPGFLSFMNTPILRATKGQQRLLFYNDGEFETWKESLPNQSLHGWIVKYFKGLGTSTKQEWMEYFANKKIVDFAYSGEISDNAIDKVFNKKRADDRKTWLENYDRHAYLDTSFASIQYEQFIDREMIHFSTYDCARSIPNMVDGLKISLRKILFCAFKRNLTKEMKVAQFAAYVSEKSAYHHGEASLNGAIVAMAQNFVGSNNIPLLQPNGQFGTRMTGGDDSAAERYIFTELNPLTRYIFREEDDAILTYLNDDGTMVEPEHYLPILPFVLINGVAGIGTGFSSTISPFNPMDVINALRRRITGNVVPYSLAPAEEDEECLIPYYEGFKGKIESISRNKFQVSGTYVGVASASASGSTKIQITELPVGTWTLPYKTYLEELEQTVDKATGKRLIKDSTFMGTDTEINFQVQLHNPMTDAQMDKLFKLSTTISNTNMHLFNEEGRLHKYQTISEIINDFYVIRLQAYGKRKESMLRDLERQLVRLTNKQKYILETLEGTIDLRRKSQQEIDAMLTLRGYIALSPDSDAAAEQTTTYNYLTKMAMDSVSRENVESLMKQQGNKQREYDELKGTKCETIWMRELEEFETQYQKYITSFRAKLQGEKPKKATEPTKKRGAMEENQAGKKMLKVVGGKLDWRQVVIDRVSDNV
jgi:DNA topoisomerase-2